MRKAASYTIETIYFYFFISCLFIYSWLGTEATTFKPQDSGSTRGASPALGITVEKSVEFSYEELASATDTFSLANKIGEGGFGAVYYAELRGEVSIFSIFFFFYPTEKKSEAKFLFCAESGY